MATHKAPLDSIAKASSAPMKRQDEFGCRTLAVLKGAGFDVLFSSKQVLIPSLRSRKESLGPLQAECFLSMTAVERLA